MKVTIIDRINCQSRKSLRVALASRVIKKVLESYYLSKTSYQSDKSTWKHFVNYRRSSLQITPFSQKIAVFGSTNGRTYLCEFINKSLETGDQDNKTPKVDSKGAWPAIRMINGMVIKLFINIYQMTAQEVLVMLLGVPNGLNDRYSKESEPLAIR